MHLPSSLLLVAASLVTKTIALPADIDATHAERDYGFGECLFLRELSLLRGNALFANRVCRNLLNRNAQSTKTNTVTVSSTLTGAVVKNVVSGTSTASTTVTTGFTVTDTDTIYATETDSITDDKTMLQTEYVTVMGSDSPPQVTTVSTTTHTLIAQQAPPPPRRGIPQNLGQYDPLCPKALKTIALDIARSACDCFLGPPPRQQPRIITVTATTTSTINSISTQTVTVPSTTTTATQTITTTATTVAKVFQTDDVYRTRTVDVDETAIHTITEAGAPPNTVTETVTSTATYSSISGVPTSQCVYNEYYDYEEVSNDPTNNYQAGVNECADKCDVDARCKFWFFYQSDPSYRNFGDNSAYCMLDSVPYQSVYLQCGVGFVLYDQAYNKIAIN